MQINANNPSESNASATPGTAAPGAAAQTGPFEPVIDRLTRGVALLDPEGRVAACNAAFARLVGKGNASEVMLLDLQRQVADDDRAQYRRTISKAIQAGTAGPQVVMFSAGAGEPGVWAEVVATRVTDQPGERRVVLELANAADSRRRQADALALQQKLYHLEQSNRELADRARADARSEMEHRLRVALTSVVGYAESLQDLSLSPAAREEAIHTIHGVVDELLKTFDAPANATPDASPDVSTIEAGAAIRVPVPGDVVKGNAGAAPISPTTSAKPIAQEQSGVASSNPGALPALDAAPRATPNVADVKQVEPTHPRVERGDPLRGRKFRGKVLVVEDSKDNQRLLTFLLRKLGLQVETADHGLDAVDRYSTAVVSSDLVLLDMQMPQLDGYQTASALRSRGYAKPIVALTANAREGDRERCIAAGCSEYMAKPVDRRRLVSILAAHLQPGQPDVEPAPMSAYYDPQPSVPIPLPLRGGESIEARRKLQDELPGIAAQLWTCATTTPVVPAVADAARRTLRDLADRGRAAGMADIAALADEAETSIRLGADIIVVHHALGRLLRTISRDDEDVRTPPPLSIAA